MNTSRLRVFLILVICTLTSAQAQTGIPRFGSFSDGLDTINLGNLNVHFGPVPIFSKPGRETPLIYELSVDSSIYSPVGPSGSQHWQPAGGWGWRDETEVLTGYLSYQTTLSSILCGSRPNLMHGVDHTTSNWIYHDRLGGLHPFTGGTDFFTGQCGGAPTSFTAVAADGSGYTLNANGSLGTITSTDGQTATPPVNQGVGSVTSTDRNGNQITVTYNGTAHSSTFTDTLGATALTITGTAPGPVVYTYTDSNGTQRSVSVSYTAYTVQTNFGCSGISEYGPTANTYLISGISFPNGTSYSITYEPTPGAPGNITGRIQQITLPTGGTVTYAYTGGNNGIECTDGTTAGLSRTTIDGTTSYARSGSGTAWTTTVTDPQNNQTVINFQTGTPSGSTVTNFYETHRTVYQGSASANPPAILAQVDTCYNTSLPPCSSTALTLPFTQIGKYLTLSNNQQSLVLTELNSFGLTTGVIEYDFGQSAPGALLRNTIIAYASLGNGIVSLPGIISVKDGGGTVRGKTVFNYDETTPTPTSGVPQHIAISGSRGNLTSIGRWFNTTNTNLTTTLTYDDTGNLLSSKDPNSNQTTFSYSDNWANTDCPGTNTLAFRTQSTNALDQNTKRTYYPCTGLLQAIADQNDINAARSGTTYTYDLVNRLTTTNFPDGGSFSSSYNDISPSFSVGHSALQTAGNLVSLDTISLDQMGRYASKTTIDPQGYDYTNTSYDSLGRVSQVTDPHRTANNPSSGSVQIQYDALHRVTRMTKSDGTFSTADYSQAPVVTVTDEAGKVRRSQLDGVGRLVKIWEDPNDLNYETDYQYDALGDLLRVDQKGSAPSDSTQWRTRTFTYDSLSRPLCVSQPEVGGSVTCPTPDNGTYTTGTIRYTYDNNSNVHTRQAPAPNQTGSATITVTYQYDPLNRISQKSYSDSTPSAFFAYDGAGWWGVTQTNTVGRLQEEWAGTSCCATAGAAIFGYDPMGRVILNTQFTPAMGYQSVSYTYDLMGDMTSYTTGVGVTFTQSFDTLGRITQLTSSLSDWQHPATLATIDSAVGYYATGALRKLTYGNNLTESPAFNIRLQPCRINLNTSAGTLLNCGDSAPTGTVQDLTYGYNAGSDNGNMASFSASGTQAFNRSYGYDSLNRLISMSAPGDSCSGLSWTLDAWGNRTDQTTTGGTCFAFHQPVNSQNQFSSSPYSYDAAGNLANDGAHTYAYDGENRLSQVDAGNTASYAYDALGRRVHKTFGSAWTDVVFDLSGNVVTEFSSTCGACWYASHIYLNGSLLADYKDGTTYFAHKDHLSSTRLLTAAGAGTRIQSSGGTNTWKYYYTGVCPSTSGAPYSIFVWVKNQGSTSMKIGGNIVDGPVIAPGTTQRVNFTETGDGTSCIQLGFETLNAGDAMDVVAFSPSINASGTALIPPGNRDFSGWNTYMGSSVTLTQGQAFVIDSMDYQPYGEQIAGSTFTTHKFTGDERDSESNLDHTLFRQYSSAQGRWMTPDPYLGSMDLSNPQSLNRYPYGLNNPWRWLDPTGLEVCRDEKGTALPEVPDSFACEQIGGSWDSSEPNQTAEVTTEPPQEAPEEPPAPPDLLLIPWTAVDPIVPSYPSTFLVPTTPGSFVTVPNPLPFPGYNYCGPGNAGGTPTNGTDAICQAHDQCYHDNGLNAQRAFGTLTPQQENAKNMCNAILCQSIANTPASSAADAIGQGMITTWFATQTSGGYANYCYNSPKFITIQACMTGFCGPH